MLNRSRLKFGQVSGQATVPGVRSLTLPNDFDSLVSEERSLDPGSQRLIRLMQFVEIPAQVYSNDLICAWAIVSPNNNKPPKLKTIPSV